MEAKSNLATTDTITALATPSGRGGIAIVRVSGPQTISIMQAILGVTLKPRVATYLPFYDEMKDIVDEGVALYFPNPHSFTGEDVLELQGHGGPVVVDLLLQTILRCGARLARPGEFSERAFLNGKLDLAQAEAVADLIDATSKQAARSALRSLQGAFSKAVHATNEKIIHLRMYIEAAIDFSEEEIDFLADDRLQTNLQTILDELTALQRDAKQGSFLREGITAVIAGEPNVGKSSLLNALSGKEVAIVTDIPGTTRDILRDYILIEGMPMHIIDTAGLRDSNDVVEQEGIRRAHQEIAKADIVLYMTAADVSHPTALTIPIDRPVIKIRNKIDVVAEEPSITRVDDMTVVSLSAKTGAGLSLLTQHIKATVGFHGETEGVFLARRRHLDALARAQVHLEAARIQLSHQRAGELAAEDLRLAHQALGEITGEFTVDDLLGKIFSTFCVGK